MSGKTLTTEERVGAEAAVVTRAMSKRDTEGGVTNDATESIRDLFLEFPQRTDHQEGVSSHDRVQVEEQELGTSGDQKDDDAGAAAMDEDSSARGDGRGQDVGARVIIGQTEELPVTRGEMIRAQRQDPDLRVLYQKALTKEEAKGEASCFYVDQGLLKRKWRSPETPSEPYEDHHQVVIPRQYRREVIKQHMRTWWHI